LKKAVLIYAVLLVVGSLIILGANIFKLFVDDVKSKEKSKEDLQARTRLEQLILAKKDLDDARLEFLRSKASAAPQPQLDIKAKALSTDVEALIDSTLDDIPEVVSKKLKAKEAELRLQTMANELAIASEPKGREIVERTMAEITEVVRILAERRGESPPKVAYKLPQPLMAIEASGPFDATSGYGSITFENGLNWGITIRPGEVLLQSGLRPPKVRYPYVYIENVTVLLDEEGKWKVEVHYGSQLQEQIRSISERQEGAAKVVGALAAMLRRDLIEQAVSDKKP
jgi:hypothetical protein